MDNNYYIYFYYEIDSVNPFYIGKGKDNRAYQHLWSSVIKKNDRFHSKLRSMIEQKEEFLIEFEEGLTESEALQREIELIRYFGRLDINTGCLCNHTDGGEGTIGSKRTLQQLLNNFLARIGRKQSLEHARKSASNSVGRKDNYDVRIQRSKKRAKQIVEKITNLHIDKYGTPVESFSLITNKTIECFRSIGEASRLRGYSRQGITRVLNGQRISHGEMGWRYQEIKLINPQPIDYSSFAYQAFEDSYDLF